MTHGSYNIARRLTEVEQGTRKMHPGLKNYRLKRAVKNRYQQHVNNGVEKQVTFCTKHVTPPILLRVDNLSQVRMGTYTS